jgi:hypothetical protein
VKKVLLQLHNENKALKENLESEKRTSSQLRQQLEELKQGSGKSKRRRHSTGEICHDGTEERDPDFVPEPPKVKRKITPAVKKAESTTPTNKRDKRMNRIKQRERLITLYSHIGNMAAPEDPKRKITELFMELPDKEEYSDYYDTILQPICLNDIMKKIQSEEDYSLIDMDRDMTLLCGNAQKYNVKGSQIYNDAVLIFNEFKKARKTVTHTVHIQEINEDTMMANE